MVYAKHYMVIQSFFVVVVILAEEGDKHEIRYEFIWILRHDTELDKYV